MSGNSGDSGDVGESKMGGTIRDTEPDPTSIFMSNQPSSIHTDVQQEPTADGEPKPAAILEPEKIPKFIIALEPEPQDRSLRI